MVLGHILGSILIVYSWLAAAVLVMVLFLIGRFYEIRFGQRSYYQLFLIPLILFCIGAIWDAFFANEHTGDPLLDFVGTLGPDLVFLSGGLVLITLCYLLLRTMIGGRK
jgi:hypothetical protein